MNPDDITKAIERMIEEKSRNIIADMEINVYVNGTLVETDTRDDHMGSIDVYLNRESLAEALEEIPDCEDVLTFGNTGCLRRVS